MRGLLIPLLAAGAALLTGGPLAIPVQELRSIGGLPAHLAGAFDEITACHLTRDGNFVVLDRRQHAVFAVEPAAAKPRKIVQIGAEAGRLLQPIAFDSAPDGTFLVADQPGSLSRIQIFVYSGAGLGGFTMPGTPQVRLGDMVISGISALEYTGSSILISQPHTGNLLTEYSTDGRVLRSFGDLRPTGQEHDPAVHIALNIGFPLTDPAGGVYYVFASGPPMFRKYDRAGALLFERHIQGVEVDPFLLTLPTIWEQRGTAGDERPLLKASVRAAGVDPDGQLWVSLAVPYTYVFDSQGDKIRALQFRAAGTMSPSSFFFTRDRRVLITPGCYAFDAATTA